MFVLNSSRALYFSASSSSKQPEVDVQTQLDLWRNFLQSNPPIHKEVTDQGSDLPSDWSLEVTSARLEDTHPGWEWDRTEYIAGLIQRRTICVLLPADLVEPLTIWPEHFSMSPGIVRDNSTRTAWIETFFPRDETRNLESFCPQAAQCSD
jgi:hypothetical protein